MLRYITPRAEKTRNRQAVRRRFGIRVGNQTCEITLVIVAIGALRQISAEQIDAAPTPSRTRHASDFEAAVFGVEVEDFGYHYETVANVIGPMAKNDLGRFCVVGQTRIDPPFRHQSARICASCCRRRRECNECPPPAARSP